MPMDSGPCFTSAAAICDSSVLTSAKSATVAAGGPSLSLLHFPALATYG